MASESGADRRPETGARGPGTMMRPRDLVQLVRLPLVITAVGDPVVGLFLAGGDRLLPHLAVALAAAFLYVGGMALNDLFDAKIDRAHHPQRMLPSGRVHPRDALTVGATCLVIGVGLACLARLESGMLAAGLALIILGYDAGLKNLWLLGNLGMGMCRGLSLLMGAAAASGFSLPAVAWVAAGVHVVYIASVTAVSRQEDDARTAPVVRRRVAWTLFPGLLALLAVPVSFAHGLMGALPAAGLAGRWLWTLIRGPSTWSRSALAGLVGQGVAGVVLLDAAYAWGAGGWALGAGFVAVYLVVVLARTP